jgi:hypothetical protein
LSDEAAWLALVATNLSRLYISAPSPAPAVKVTTRPSSVAAAAAVLVMSASAVVERATVKSAREATPALVIDQVVPDVSARPMSPPVMLSPPDEVMSPAVEIDQLLSVIETLVALASPIVIVLA